MKFVLASSSVYRLNLLKQIHIHPEIVIPDIDETALINESPLDTAMRLAQAKLIRVQEKIHSDVNLKHLHDAVLIAADQVLMVDNHALGKAITHEKAVAQLCMMRNKPVMAYTAMAMSYQTHHMHKNVSTIIKMRNYSDAQIEAYLRIEKPYDCAGSVKSEGLGAMLIEYMRSDDPSSLVGLPILSVLDGLQKFDLYKNLLI
jgi:septum formation protein